MAVDAPTLAGTVIYARQLRVCAKAMSGDQLTQALMSLPLPERMEVAQALWQSIHEAAGANTDSDERDAVREAQRRDAERNVLHESRRVLIL